MKKNLTKLILGLGIAGSALAQTSITGPSSSQSPYLQPMVAGSTLTSVFTATNSVGGYTMCGTPDGIGVYDNGDGTFTMLMNHEFGNTAGSVRAHGSLGAFVSKWIINKSNLSVVSGQDLMQNVNLWTGTTYTTYNATNPSTLAAFGRFCSGDLPAVTAFYNPGSGAGTQERIFMNGEETGNEGRAMAHIATGPNAGTSWELPFLGKASWENYVASPFPQNKTIVIGMDDSTPGQVYVYVGTKQTSGNEITKAGLTNGKLYGVAVLGLLNEGSSVPAANSVFNLIDMGAVQNITGTTLNTNSNNVGVTNFLRPEDGAWDPSNPRDFYFATTNSFSAPSRLWRLRFNDISKPELGGTITAVLNGTEGQKMLDNIGINKYGQIMLVEDVGNNAHNGKMWQYNIGTGTFSMVAQHDTTRFISGGANFLTQDEEASGVIDAQEVLGPGMWLFVDQAHYSIPAPIVEGGQILAFYNPSSALANPEINVQGNSTNIAFNSTITNTGNNTNFGSANLGTQIIKTYVIQNSGPGTLAVTSVSVGGLNAGDYTILSAPLYPYNIPANGSLTVYVRFSPGTTGLRKGMVYVYNNDFDESAYSFAIEGTGVEQEINVLSNSAGIAAGTTSVSLTNNTDFGSTLINMPVTRTFEIQNTGTGPLSIGSISINGNSSFEFSLINAGTFPANLSAGSSMTFAVQYAPVTVATRTANITIMNDDADESVYSFVISAKALTDVGIRSVSANELSLSLFPNPAADEVALSINTDKKQAIEVQVTDLLGRTVQSHLISEPENAGSVLILNTSKLSNGAYIVNVKQGQSKTQIKLVVNQ